VSATREADGGEERDHEFDGMIDFLVCREAADAKANARVRHVLVYAQCAQHIGRLLCAGVCTFVRVVLGVCVCVCVWIHVCVCLYMCIDACVRVRALAWD